MTLLMEMLTAIILLVWYVIEFILAGIGILFVAYIFSCAVTDLVVYVLKRCNRNKR